MTQTISGRAAGPKGAGAVDSKEFSRRFDAIVANVGLVIKGKEESIRLALTALLANGHILFEDVPGTGKTMLARALAQSIDAGSNRVQCTPDLLPADVTGLPVLDRKTGEFLFRQGPVFTNVLLVDEINRATPKTQSALLEAMAERRVTVDGVTHELPKPFFVIATENPVELAGTFPLPEAQLDRFLFKLSLGYADRDAEVEVMKVNRAVDAIASLGPVIDVAGVLEMMEWAAGVSVSDEIYYYIADICQASRNDSALELGASSRASLSLLRAASVIAASEGRDDVLPDDVKRIVPAVFNHRLMLSSEAMLQDERVTGVVERILGRVRLAPGAPDGDARR